MFSFFKKPKEILSEPKLEPDSKNTFMGLDMDNWNFLGYTAVTTNEYITVQYFLFLDKEEKNREYRVVPGYLYEKKWDSNIPQFELWRLKQRNIFDFVNNPTLFFKDYMLKHYNALWDNKTNKWIEKQPSSTNYSIPQTQESVDNPQTAETA